MKHRCKECGREWDYPFANCIFCGCKISNVDIDKYTVEEIVQVFVPTEDHPITPYYIMLMKDSDGSYRFQKTFQRFDIGQTIPAKEGLNENLTIGIVGTGITSKGLAEVALRAGAKVILKSRSHAALDTTLDTISRNLSKSINSNEVQIMLKNVIPTTEYELLAESDFVIESVIEDIEVKRNVFHRLDSTCDPDVILASNTSSLQISQIAKDLKYPERVVGLHFFNPIVRMQLVEIVKGDSTSEDVLVNCAELVSRLNKVSILVKDTPGFVVNRLLFAMINEACHMLDRGTSRIENIDKAMKLGANFPMGPFELADFIGIDLCRDIIENLNKSSNSTLFLPCDVMIDLIEKGHLGKKTGKGFYEY